MPTSLAHATRPATGTSLPPFARLPVLAVAAVVGVVHLVLSGFGGGYYFDELLMLMIGREHLDWGSADQPPLTPLLAALMDAIAPGSMIALRIPAVLATAAAVVVAALIARELGGDRRAQLLTAGAQATVVWGNFFGHWLAPYSLEPVQWLLVFWLLVRWVRTRNDRLLPVLGVVVGIAAETKFQVLALCAVLALSVLAAGPRELLRRPLLWAGVAIAAVLTAPTLIWQAVHGWPQLRMGSVVVAEAEYLNGGRPGVAVTMLIGAGIAGTVLVLYGVYRLLVASELREYRFIGVTAVAMFAFFVIATGRLYYLDGIYGMLAAAGALGLQRRREAGRRRWRWVAWPALLVSAALTAGVFSVSLGATPPAPSRQIASAVADAYRALPPDRRAHTVVLAGSYIYATFVDQHAAELGLPPAYSGNRSYGYFDPPPADADTVLWVSSSTDGLNPDDGKGPIFTDVRRVGGVGDGTSVWQATRVAPWEQAWPRLRTLTVS